MSKNLIRDNVYSTLFSILFFVMFSSSFAQETPQKSSPAPKGYPYRFVNLMPSFWQFRDRAQDGQKQAKNALFRRWVIEQHRQVYEAVVAGWLNDQYLGRYISSLESRVEELRRTDARFPERLHKSWLHFSERLPDLNGNATLYLIPAPRSAAGGAVRPFGKQDVVIFGADQMAALMDSEAEFNAFVQHELTHLYHMQVNPEMREMADNFFMQKEPVKPAKLYQVLWLEGLAVCFSKAFNPDATVKDVLLSENLPSKVKANWAVLTKGLREHLDSTDKDDINAYVYSGSQGKGIPTRAGYYVGMLISEEMRNKHSLKELARLHGVELRSEIESVLRKLESSNPSDF